MYVGSPFCNIYLRHMRCLAVCQSSLCQWLDEVRTSEAMRYFESIPQVESFALDNLGSAIDPGEGAGEEDLALE